MRNIKKTLKLKGHFGKVYTLTEELLNQGYFIHKYLRGWQLCKNSTSNQIWWSSSLKNLDDYLEHQIKYFNMKG